MHGSDKIYVIMGRKTHPYLSGGDTENWPVCYRVSPDEAQLYIEQLEKEDAAYQGWRVDKGIHKSVPKHQEQMDAKLAKMSDPNYDHYGVEYSIFGVSEDPRTDELDFRNV